VEEVVRQLSSEKRKTKPEPNGRRLDGTPRAIVVPKEVPVPLPKTAPSGALSSWVRTLRSRSEPWRGVNEGLVYRTRREARSRAAWYARELRARGLDVETTTRLRYRDTEDGWESWIFVLWRRGDRPRELY
jgi:hypothetical protein